MIKTRRAYLRVLHGLVASAHVVVVPALLEVTSALAAVGIAGLGWALGSWRMQIISGDAPRSRHVVRWLDVPVLCHVAAGLFGLCLWPGVLVVGVLLEHAGVLPETGPEPLIAASASYVLALPLAVWAVTAGRLWVRMRTVVVRVPGWPRAFDGYRIAHLSDLHVGSFDPPERARRWLERAQATEPDLVVLTGDLVAAGTGFYSAVSQLLGELRAPDGVIVVTGNHDQWDRTELVRQLEAEGVSVLDGRSCEIVHDEDRIVVAGMGGEHAVALRADRLLARFQRVPTVLLAHDPAVFPAAAAAGVPLTLSGHTHAGQVAVPFFGRWANMARLAARYTVGLYRLKNSWLYVSPGLGVTGLPVRLGARPEITVIEMHGDGTEPVPCQAQSHRLRFATENAGCT